MIFMGIPDQTSTIVPRHDEMTAIEAVDAELKPDELWSMFGY
jgi:hypothetical protein